MAQFIALIILLISLAVLVFIAAKKISVLKQMPEVHEGMQKENIWDNLKKKIKGISFDKLIFLKTLSKSRVYILKIEKYIDNRLQKMRKKIVKKQEEERKDKNTPA